MTKRDFFRVIIKLFGLYSAIITLFTILPQNAASFAYMGESVNVALYVLLISAAIVCFFLFILFRTDTIIDKLNLDKGFDDERIEFGNLSNESIFKFAIILIGGFLIIDNVTNLFELICNIFRNAYDSTSYSFQNKPYSYSFFMPAFNVLLGYLFITNYRGITKFLNKH